MAYEPINWTDYPDDSTPLSAINLNKMDSQIKANADALDGMTDIPATVAQHTTDIAKNSNDIIELNNNLTTIDMLGWTVPSECPIQNGISGNQFIQKVQRVDISTLDLKYNTGNGFYATLDTAKSGGKCYCVGYTYSATVWDKDKKCGINTNNTPTFWITNSAYTDVTAFKNAMKGVYLYYELATPITKTIDGNEAVTELKNDLTRYEENGYVSKNLINIPNYEVKMSDETYTWNNGIFTIKGSTTTDNYVALNGTFILKKGTYTLSCSGNFARTERDTFFVRRKSDNQYFARFLLNTKEKVTFSMTETTEVFVGFVPYEKNVTHNDTIYVQLEEGTEATSWTPYAKSNVELTNGLSSLIATLTQKGILP